MFTARGKVETSMHASPSRNGKKLLDAWLRERHGRPDDPLFASIRGGKLSRDAIERLLA